MKSPSPTLQPWLGWRARLFLSPISVALISLLFLAFRVLSASSDVNDSISLAKSRLLSSCFSAEHTASLATSLPHFLATASNQQLADSITATVRGSLRVALLSITAIEQILVYFANSYRSMFLCYMELLVRGSLAVLMEAVQLISQAVTAAAQGIRAALQEAVQGVNTVLATAVSGINSVVGVFGQHITPPQIGIPPLTALDNVALPHEIQDGLLKLNASLPTLQDLKTKMDDLIQTPFDAMRQEVNATLGGFRFNHTLLPVPDMRNVTFCDRIDTSPLDELGKQLKRAARWGLILLALIALLVMVVAAAKESWCYEREVKSVERTRAVWLAQNADDQVAVDGEKNKQAQDVPETGDFMSLLSISQHPLLYSFVQSVGQRVGIRTKQAQHRLLWLLSFLTHPAALACLFTGVLGLLTVSLQLFLIRHLTSSSTSSIDTSLTHLSNTVLDLIDESSRNASLAFSSATNHLILEVENELNSHFFHWVNTTTTTMNNTLNDFVDGITSTLDDTFGGTPFNAPLQTFVQCILGQKVNGIEKALTWIHDNAYVNFTLVPEDVLEVKGAQKEAIIQPVKTALWGASGNEGVVGGVLSRYRKHLLQERLMFAILVGVWLFILLVGLLAIVYACYADRKLQLKEQSPEEKELELQRDLKASPSQSWLPILPKWKRGVERFGRLPSPESNAKATHKEMEETDQRARRVSLTPSSRSKHSHRHIAKDSISYPLQIHHTLDTATSLSTPRAPNPTPLRNVSTSRDTVVSLPPQQPPARADRTSWLSFLATLATDDQVLETKETESAEDRFQRLFGCSPAASPTIPRFAAHLSAPPDLSGEEGGGKFRQTSNGSWIGSKSPIPPAKSSETNGEEVTLHRGQGRRDKQGEEQTSYRIPAPQVGGGQQQACIRTPQSISFYAW